MEIIFTGATKAAKQIIAAALSGTDALAGKLYQEAEVVMAASKQQYVPVDTGALRASGFVEPPQVAGFEKRMVTLGFGGPSAPYAVIVHEDLTLRHTVGQAKYLEIPLRARMQGMAAVLKLRLDEVTKQAIQRLAKVETNVGAGRDVNWGMPLFRDPNAA